MGSEPHVLLLTGEPGAGKTTTVIRAVRRLEGVSVRGFYTEKVRDEEGRRTGFELVAPDGARRTMASVEITGPPRVSRYGVDAEAVDRFTASELEAPAAEGVADLFVIDEIGKMECCSDRFVGAVERLLAGDVPLLATVARRGGGLIHRVKEHPASTLWEIAPENRDVLPGRLARWVRGRVEGPS